MRLTVLGSGTNVHPARAAAGYLVETDQLLLFDLGPRTLMNLIKVGADRHRVRHLFITHHHTDHFADFLPFFFDAVFRAKFVAPRPGLTIYGPRGTRRLFGTLVKVVPGFSTAPFPVTITELVDRTIRIGRTRVTAGTVVHSRSLHCQGYRVAHDGAVFTYSGDSEYCAGRVAREAGVKRLVLSHFYPVAERYDVVAQAGRTFGGRITMARDRMRITLPSRAAPKSR